MRMQPPNDLLSSLGPTAAPLEWTDQAQASFMQIKEDLAAAALLAHPQPDAAACLMMDASDIAVGAWLQQFVDETWQPLAFFSKSLSPVETCNSTYGRELLAVYTAVKYFCHFLEVWSSCLEASLRKSCQIVRKRALKNGLTICRGWGFQ